MTEPTRHETDVNEPVVRQIEDTQWGSINTFEIDGNVAVRIEEPLGETHSHVLSVTSSNVSAPAPVAPAPAPAPAAPAAAPAAVPQPCRNISGISYFSRTLQADADALAKCDIEGLIHEMEEQLQDADSASMRKIIEEFNQCQSAIVDMVGSPSEDTYRRFQTALQRFFEMADQYAVAHPVAPRVQTEDQAHKALADTDIERSTLGMRLRFLIAELKEMKSTIAPLNTMSSMDNWREGVAPIRTSLAQLAGPKVFSMDRQAEMEKYIAKAEALLGSKGLKLTSVTEKVRTSVIKTVMKYTVNPITYRIGDVRNTIMRLVIGGTIVVTGAGYTAYKGAQYMFGGSGSSAPSNQPPSNPSATKTPEQLRQEEVNRIFHGMKIRVERGKLYVSFPDTGSFTVNKDLAINVGPVGSLRSERVHAEGSEFSFQLPRSLAQTGSEVGVSIQVEVVTKTWLPPIDSSNQPDVKKIRVP